MSNNELGVIAVLMERFQRQRLPRTLSLKQRVDRGDRLSSMDIDFLKDVFADATSVKPLADAHPEYQELCAKVMHLYHEITEKALENESRGASEK